MPVYNRIDEDIITALKAVVGDKYVLTDPERLAPYEKDESANTACYRQPEAVVLPARTEEVAAIMRLANNRKFPVIPRGAGTGLEAGAIVNEYGGILLSLERMNALLGINEENLYAVVEPGVITARLQAEAEKKGLLYAGDPCSGGSCFIGGNAATNAGGNRAVKYGTTRDQIYAVEVVTPGGDIVELGGRVKKMTTGYALEKVIIGSEGTLGIITKLTLKLVPLPLHSAHILAVFEDADKALFTVNALQRARVEVTCLEFMDNECIRVAERFTGEKQVGSERGNYIIIQVDGKSEDETDGVCVTVDEICRAQGAAEVFIGNAEKIWYSRKIFSEASGAEGVVAMEDFVVPPDCIAVLLRELQVIGKDAGLAFRSVSHAGDGNIHLDVLKERLSQEVWEERLGAFESAAYDVVYRLGGKISGEHGIGGLRKDIMKRYTSPVELQLMKALKKAWDPNLILNPGKIFDVD